MATKAIHTVSPPVAGRSVGGGGVVEVKVPPNARNGLKLRLKERGLPGKPAGHLYLLLEIALPPADSEAARQAYEQLARAAPFNPRRHLGTSGG